MVAYSLAATTGGLRIAKDKHWISDVLAGAGIGILSTRSAYGLYPFFRNQIIKDDHFTFAPFYQNGAGGLSMNIKL